MPVKPTPVAERLKQSSVRKGYCLIYLRCPNVERPKIALPGGRHELVYRVAYELAYGPIPPGHDVHHSCETLRCIEPTHLRALTRSAHADLHTAEADTCLHGHPWTEANTYIRGYSAAGRPLQTCRRCRSLNQSRRDRQRRRTNQPTGGQT